MNWLLLGNSLMVGSLATVISVGFGFLAALWMGCLPARARPWFFAAAIIALALPPFLVTNCWLYYLGRVGVWRSWLPFDIFSLGGSIWVLSMLLWPLSFFLVWGSWQRLEPAQMESDMLVTGRQLIRALLLPLANQALILGTLLTLALALNNFAVPAILQVKVLPAEMWIRFNTEFDTWGALRSSYPLLLVPILLVFFLSRHPIRWPHFDTPVSHSLFRRQLGVVWFWLGAVVTFVLLGCSVVLPLFQILTASRTWSEFPGAVAAGRDAIWNSFWYAGATATIVMIIGLIAAVRLEVPNPKSENRKQKNASAQNGGHFFGLRIFALAGWLAFLMPGVLLGIALIYAFNHDWSARLYQGAGIVILAFVIRYLVIGCHASAQSVRGIDKDLLDVALVEGATCWQLLRHVIWPQIKRPLLVTWYLLFLFCLWDVESMILVVPPGGETLALRIFNLLHYGHNAQVNALCLTLLMVAVMPLMLAEAVRWTCGQSLRFSNRSSALTVPQLRTTPKLTMPLALLSCLMLVSCTPDKGHFSSTLFDKVQIIGVRGVGVGQLNKPRSLAIDSSDNLYVVDMTGRVQKFSSNGVFLLSWQMPQIERGKPKGMGHDLDGNIFVVEPHYSRVNLFSPMGKLLTQWGSHGTNAGELSMPRAVAENSHQEIFVSEYQEIERVQKFAFGKKEPPMGDAGNKTDIHPPPRYLGGFGQAGTAPGEFNRPEGLCVDSQDRLYVTDSCNHRIQVFDRDGKFLRAYGKAGKEPGELSYPYDICVDKEGRQYVCEFGNSRIQVFDAQDKPIEIIGGPGVEPGRFNNPWGVALDSAGNLYVADSQNHRVQKLLRKR